MSPRPSGTEPSTDLEAVVGLEVHCQLRTRTKAFCSCPNRFGDGPNRNTCPTCLGHPGALPVFNERALELALRLALATGCRIRERSVFARKSYFYPDLAKGYQITQADEPLAEDGRFDVETAEGRRRSVRIERLHLEEDAGKSLHSLRETVTLVDYNRAGTPLVELVTAPDFRAPAEVHAFLVELRRLVRQLGVSDGNMEQGSLRCDCNVSVRPRGSDRLGTRVELKNLSSFRSVVRAIEHEVARQGEILAAGGAVERSTRGWDESRGVSHPQRVKEGESDYRYFPDPDLPPLEVSGELLQSVRAALPELPQARRKRFETELGASPADAGVLTSSRALADYFEELADACGDPCTAAKWVLGEVLRDVREREEDLDAPSPRFPVAPARLAELIELVRAGDVSASAAKTAFAEMARGGRSAADVVDELELRQVADETALREVVREVFAAHPSVVAEWQAGKRKVRGFLFGQAMQATGGRAAPDVLGRVLLEELDSP